MSKKKDKKLRRNRLQIRQIPQWPAKHVSFDTRKNQLHQFTPNIERIIAHYLARYSTLLESEQASSLQSKLLKRSSDERIKFIITNFISGSNSIIRNQLSIQIKPQFKTRILIGLLLASGARLA